MRTVTSLVAAGLLATALTACSDDSDDGESSDGPGPSTGATAEADAGDVSAEDLDLACTFDQTDRTDISLGAATITGTNDTGRLLSQLQVSFKLVGPDGELEADVDTSTFVTYVLDGEQLAVRRGVLSADDADATYDTCEITDVSVSTLAGEPTIQPEGATCEVLPHEFGNQLVVDLSGVEDFPAAEDQFIGVRELDADGARVALNEQTVPAGETELTLEGVSEGDATCDLLYFRDV